MTVADFKKERNEKIKSRYEELKKITGRGSKALSVTATEFGLSTHAIDSIIYPRIKTKTVPKEQ
ncbi:hypothetical protein GOQ30_11470 [Flavobacterium sp. TP390]|uniref:Uncharacterized protein n=1 Tax=Flavobacterium profundi TaxID=1774945 RepID=A0A6I4IJI0_9FLAO|nr:hypothetical protein [Flavobacterium profundi]MVO09778.1 hypothetical protein [Flavobacterium profundi]